MSEAIDRTKEGAQRLVDARKRRFATEPLAGVIEGMFNVGMTGEDVLQWCVLYVENEIVSRESKKVTA